MDTIENITEGYCRDLKVERAVGIFSLAILFLLALLFVLYKLVGFDELVKNMYYGHSFGFLNDLIKYQQTKGVEHYIHLANRLFHYGIFISIFFLGFANLIAHFTVFKKPPRPIWIYNLAGAMIKIKYSLIEKVSLFYLFIPTVLFCAGWLKLYFSVPIIAIIAIGLYFFCKREKKAILQEEDYLTATYLTAILVLGTIFFVVLLSGIGGYTYQVRDYQKHAAFFRDLIEYDWPLGYKALGPEKEPHVLVTYIGYYLPSALMGKMFGFEIGNHFSFVWANLGVLLTILWFYRVIGKATFFFALFFLFFSGLDIIGWTILQDWPENLDGLKPIDYWTKDRGADCLQKLFWIFPSNICILYVGPHHVLPNWIATLMVLYYGFIRKTCSNLLFLSSACLVGSAFVSIGLLPYVLIAMVYTKGKKLLTFQNIIAGPVIVLTIALFVISNDGHFPRGFIWKFHNIWNYWPTLVLFYFLEFGLYTLLMPKVKQEGCHIPLRLLKWSFIVLLLAWPWYLVGNYGDFTTKASIPSLVVFSVCLAMAMIRAKTKKQFTKVNILKVLLVIGAFSGFFHMLKSLDHGVHLFGRNLKYTRHIDKYVEDKWWTAQQLFADPNGSVFWDYMAAEPSMN